MTLKQLYFLDRTSRVPSVRPLCPLQLPPSPPTPSLDHFDPIWFRLNDFLISKTCPSAVSNRLGRRRMLKPLTYRDVHNHSLDSCARPVVGDVQIGHLECSSLERASTSSTLRFALGPDEVCAVSAGHQCPRD